MNEIPILKFGRVLLMTVQVNMHDLLALNLQGALSERVVKDKAVGVLIDISGINMVNSFIGRMIANMAAMARILDARTVLVEMQLAVAITLVEFGLTLKGVSTALTVERGINLLGNRGQDHLNTA